MQRGKVKVHEVQSSEVRHMLKKKGKHIGPHMHAPPMLMKCLFLLVGFNSLSYHSVAHAYQVICQLFHRGGGVAGYDGLGIVAYEDSLGRLDN